MSRPPSQAGHSRTERRIQSLERAFALLEILGDQPEGLSLGALAKAGGLAVQTAQGLIRTLQAHGWVVQNGRGRPYRLGPAPLRLAARCLSRDGLVAAAREPVGELSRELGEYILLAELAGDSTAPLIEIRSDQALSVGSTSFDPRRMHVSATAQVLMAANDPEGWTSLLAEKEMPPCGPKSIRSADVLLRRLHEIRRRGYVICRDEAGEHISALAVPVRAADGRTRAALGVSLPTARLRPGQEEIILTRLKETAERISLLWGARADRCSALQERL